VARWPAGPLACRPASKQRSIGEQFVVREFAAGAVEDGGAEAVRGRGGEFLEKVRERLFDARGFLILMPGTFNPRMAKHIAMRWSL